MSNYKTVFFTLGVLLIVLGFSMLVPITIQLIYNEFNSTFVISSIITITFGALFFLANIDHNRSLSTQQAFLLTALSWIGVAIFGSIPFIGEELLTWIRGDYLISGITLNRLFALHVVLLPLALIAVIFVHILALHEVGSNNPDGVDVKKFKGSALRNQIG